MNKYGLFGKLQAQPGKGAQLAAVLLRAARLMEDATGLVYYIVNQQADDVDAIWITEVWENEADHDASLEIPGVRELIGEAMPILAGPPEAGVKLTVLGGKGIDH